MSTQVPYSKLDHVSHLVSVVDWVNTSSLKLVGVGQSVVWLAIIKISVFRQRVTQLGLSLQTVNMLRRIDNAKCMIPRLRRLGKF